MAAEAKEVGVFSNRPCHHGTTLLSSVAALLCVKGGSQLLFVSRGNSPCLIGFIHNGFNQCILTALKNSHTEVHMTRTEEYV